MSLFHFLLVPVDMVEKCADGSDIGSDHTCVDMEQDMCTTISDDAGPVYWLIAGEKAAETCTGSVEGLSCNHVAIGTGQAQCVKDEAQDAATGTCDLVGKCEADYLLRAESEVGCAQKGGEPPPPTVGRLGRLVGAGDADDASVDCSELLQVHMHEASCPPGCYFSPKYKFEETYRVWDLVSRLLFGSFAAIACGFLAGPARLSDGEYKVARLRKVASVIEIIIFVWALFGYIFSLWWVLAVATAMCSDHGHDAEMSSQAAKHYGGEDHWCQQYTGGSGTMLYIIICIKLVCSLGCVVGGSMVACCMPADGERDNFG